MNMKTIFLNFIGKCQMLWAHITGRKWWFVSCDIEVDETSGQGELDSCAVMEKTDLLAKEKASRILAKNWDVPVENIYVFDIVQITNPKVLVM